MRVQLRFLARLWHHLIALEGVQVVERRQTVKVHLVPKVVLLSIKHIWLVHEVSASGHVCVVCWHRGPVSAIAPEVSDLLQAVNELVPLLIEEVSLHCLLILLSHLAIEEVRGDEELRGQVIVAGVHVDVIREPVLPSEIGILRFKEEASCHDSFVLLVLDLLIHLVVVILDRRFLVNYSIVFIVLVVTEAIRVAADRALNLVPVAVHSFIIDVEVIHIAGLNRLLLLQHGVVWILFLALVNLDLALAELSPRPLFELVIEVCLGFFFCLEIKLFRFFNQLRKGFIVNLLKDAIDI